MGEEIGKKNQEEGRRGLIVEMVEWNLDEREEREERQSRTRREKRWKRQAAIKFVIIHIKRKGGKGSRDGKYREKSTKMVREESDREKWKEKIRICISKLLITEYFMSGCISETYVRLS